MEYSLFAASSLLSLAALAAMIVLWHENKNLKISQHSFWPTIFWLAHIFLFYGFVTAARIWFGYVGPSFWVSIWGAGLILHGVFSVAVGAYIRTSDGADDE